MSYWSLSPSVMSVVRLTGNSLTPSHPANSKLILEELVKTTSNTPEMRRDAVVLCTVNSCLMTDDVNLIFVFEC